MKHFKDAKYEAMKILGVEGLYTLSQIDPSTLPKNLNKYSIRKTDTEDFHRIELAVNVEHNGDFITINDIKLNDSNNYHRLIDNQYCELTINDTKRLIKEYGIKEIINQK